MHNKDAGKAENIRPRNDWRSCGIPAPQSDHAAFWLKWAQSGESRKCPCGEMVIAGACPVCGRKCGEE